MHVAIAYITYSVYSDMSCKLPGKQEKVKQRLFYRDGLC